MGYKAEKELVEKKIKRFKIVLFCIFAVFVLAFCVVSFYISPKNWKYYVKLPDVSKRSAGELRIHYVDVGQGDATLIEFPDDQVMLIDGGDGSETATKSLLRYMNALKIDEIDYLILTHADVDHYGGLAAVLSHKKVFNAYLPPSFYTTDADLTELRAALIKLNCQTAYSSRTELLVNSTDAEYPYVVKFLYPRKYTLDEIFSGELEVEDENEFSSVVWLNYNGVRALFMGDAPSSVEKLMRLEDAVGAFADMGVSLRGTEILKLSHHGSKTATGQEFLQFLGAKEGIISCGKNNDYGHPAQETLVRLQSADVKVHRTDLNGNIVVTISPDGNYRVAYVD